MRWRYEDVQALPVHVFYAAVRFVNEHLSKPSLDDLDD